MTEASTDRYIRHLPAEERLMLICARRNLSHDLREEARILAPEIDWVRMTNLSLQHRVGPMVYASLKTCLGDTTPQSTLSQLKQDALAGAQQNLGLLREAVRITRTLNEQGIRHAIFKGLVINEMVYHDLVIRKCGDIDILVDPGDFLATKRQLVSEGFSQILTDQGELQCLQSGLWHESRNFSIDLHWGLPPRELGIRSKLILDRAEPITIGGHSLSAFCPADLFIALCVNATKEYWNQLLYPYCDIHEFLNNRTDLDLKDVVSRARELRCEQIVLAALRTVARLYQTPALADFIGQSTANQVTEELLRQLFAPQRNGDAPVNHNELLTQFDTTDAYFMALMDTSLQKLAYRAIHVPLRHYAPEASKSRIIRLPKALAFMRPIIGALHIGGALMRRTFRKLAKHA